VVVVEWANVLQRTFARDSYEGNTTLCHSRSSALLAALDASQLLAHYAKDAGILRWRHGTSACH